MEKIKKRRPLLFSIILFILLPAYFLKFSHDLFIADVYTLINYCAVLAQFLLAFTLIRYFITVRSLKPIFSILISIYYVLIYIIILYKLVTGNLLNFIFLVDGEVLKTIQSSFGIFVLVPALGIIILFIGYYILTKKLLTYTDKLIIHPIISGSLLLIVSIGFIYFAPEYDYFLNQMASFKSVKGVRSTPPQLPSNNKYSLNSSDNIFIVQLESVNAYSIITAEKKYKQKYMPELYRIGRQGTIFPLFWGNSIQTHRAQENILCGLYYNDGKSYFEREQELTIPCLPEKLKEAGYTTLFFCGWPDPSFWESGDFMEHIGFDEVHYGDFMHKEDTQYRWGYDDCDVYKRVFEYLNKNYPKKSKLFVYIEMCMSHFPFEPKEEYASIHAFKEPKDFTKKYLNSMQEQDYCLKYFYSDFQQYDTGKSHLFILADHSWPTGMHNNCYNEKGAYNENFLTPLVYVPPVADKKKYYENNFSQQIFDQSDLMPTVFELLSGKPYQNSFAFALKKGLKNNSYEDCHVMVQPYNNPQVAVVKENLKYVYTFKNNSVVVYDLINDMPEKNPSIIHKNITYKKFQQKYFCKRFYN